MANPEQRAAWKRTANKRWRDKQEAPRYVSPEKQHEYNQNWVNKHPAKHIWRQAKARAARSGLDFDLSLDWIEGRLIRGRCEVTGHQFDDLWSKSPWVPSIDRIDSSRGYSMDNCRMVCWIYNLAKSTWSHDDVVELARGIMESEDGKV